VINGETLTSNETDAYLVKYDKYGSIQWVRHITGVRGQSITALSVTSNNQVIAAGYFQNTVSIDGFTLKVTGTDFGDTFLMKFDQDGNVVMATNIGYQETNYADMAGGIALDGAGNIYVAGGRGVSMYFAKVNSAGEVVWKTTYGHTSYVGTIVSGPIAVDSHGNMYASGIALHEANAYLLKFNTGGSMQWVHEFDAIVTDLEVDTHDQLIITANVYDSTAIGNVSLPEGGLIGKMNGDGNFVWHSFFEQFNAAHISVNPHDHLIYFTGKVVDDIIFGQDTIVVEEKSDLVVGAINDNGLYSWVAKAGEINGEFGAQITTDNSGDIFISSTLEKDSIGVFQCIQKTGESERDLYLAKISPFPVVPIEDAAQICPGEEAQFSYSAISDYAEYRWNVDTAHLQYQAAGPRTIKVTGQVAGLYPISIQTSVDLGCETFFINHSVSLLVKPNVEKPVVSGKGEICAGERNVHYTVSDDAVATQTLWILPVNVGVVSSDNHELIVDFATDFAATEIFISRVGECNSTMSDPFAVTAIPVTGNASPIEGEAFVCAGTTDHTFITAPIANAQFYNWTLTYDLRSYSMDQIENETTISIPSDASTASLIVTGYNECSSSSSDPFTIEIGRKPSSPGSIAGPNEGCINDELRFETTSNEAVDAFHWTIKNSKGDILLDITHAEAFVTPILREKSEVLVAAINVCGEGPVVRLTVDQTKDPSVVPEILRDCFSLYHTSNETLYWFKDDVLIGTAKEIELHHEGDYALRFIGKCSVTETKLTITEADIAEFIPNVFTPNGDPQNEYFEVSSALQGSSLAVFNRWGKQVYASESYTNTWNAPDVPSGVYFYSLKSACSGKLLKGIISVLK
jgi:gliding motility-associated-like protein